MCNMYQRLGTAEIGLIDSYNIYAPSCSLSPPKSPQTASVSHRSCITQIISTLIRIHEITSSNIIPVYIYTFGFDLTLALLFITIF